MLKWRATRSLGILVFLAAIPSLQAQSSRKKILSQADLPHFSYAVSGSASALVQSDTATFDGFASKVRVDLNGILNGYEIDDKSTLRSLLSTQADLQELSGQYPAALKTIDTLRSLEEKPAAKLTAGLFARARLQAAIESKSTHGEAFDRAFTKNYREAIDALPWDIAGDWAKESYTGARLESKSMAVADVMTDLDPAVRKSGALDNFEAWGLIGTRNYVETGAPLNELRAPILKEYIQAHTVAKPDIWPARDVTLSSTEHLTPTLVAIWDSGIDVSVYPNQLFTDPKSTVSGTHGLAYDDQGAPSKSWLYPLTPEQQKTYPLFREIVEGQLDIEDVKDTPAAQAAEKEFRTLAPEEIHQYFEADKVLGFYLHGTHCAGIAVRGNPFARLVVARFNDQLSDFAFLPTDEWVRRLGADFQQMSDYFRARHVRVVNMSWGDDPQEFETWLSKTGGGANPAERKAKARELYAMWRDSIETAIKNAPGTLFVTAAGNSDSDTRFTEDVPSSLHLPNLIAVGAVDQAGEETSFTSYGETVVVDADGYEVESYIPGGYKARFSGTSMASPGVVNLAAKLFALDPSLTPAQAIDLIRRGATASSDGRLHLIDERRSVELLRAERESLKPKN